MLLDPVLDRLRPMADRPQVRIHGLDHGARPVLQVPGVTFYSLQLGPTRSQLEGAAWTIHDLGDELTNWGRTAAAMGEMDLVIGVETAVTHLAGALGVPVWICLPASPPNFWMLERADTPLYGSARLFRQPRVGEWPAVFKRVASALQEMVRHRGLDAA